MAPPESASLYDMSLSLMAAAHSRLLYAAQPASASAPPGPRTALLCSVQRCSVTAGAYTAPPVEVTPPTLGT